LRKEGGDVEINGVFQVKPYETVDCLISQVKQFFDTTKGDPFIQFDLTNMKLCGPLANVDDEPNNEQAIGSSGTIDGFS
jgi:hypothetical protein